MRDLHFAAGNFFFGDIPKEQEFLRQYFTSDLELMFLSYYELFGSVYKQEGFLRFYNIFQDHTGCACSTRWVRKLLKRHKDITQSLEQAYQISDLKMISRIKAGGLFNQSQNLLH